LVSKQYSYFTPKSQRFSKLSIILRHVSQAAPAKRKSATIGQEARGTSRQKPAPANQSAFSPFSLFPFIGFHRFLRKKYISDKKIFYKECFL
jgi:hypothetical protein